MSKRLLLIQAHPDASEPHLCHALASSYAQGAQGAGHAVRHIKLAELDFPLLRSQQAWQKGTIPDSLKPAQEDIAWAEHILLFFPLWLGDMPALVYRWYFRAHSVKSLERNILGFVGIAPVNETLIGLTGDMKAADAAKWLAKLKRLGERAE